MEQTEAPEVVKKLAADLGGTVEECQRLPDGSGFAVVSMPLPPDHWSTVKSEKFEAPPMSFRMAAGPMREQWADKIRAAGRYAYRAATMQGTEDMDPDALLQNLVVGMLGYWTPDGTSEDAWANPDPLPALIGGGGPDGRAG